MNLFKKVRKKIGDEKRYYQFLYNKTNLSLKDNLNKLGSYKQNSMLRILGNGKSLNDSLYGFANDADYMVVNKQVLSESFEAIKPKYYVLADPVFFSRHGRFDGIRFINQIIDRTKWDMHLFIPYCYVNKEIEELIQKESLIDFVFYNSFSYYGPEKKRNYCYDHNLAMPSVGNVIVAAIAIGLALKYKEIHLFGVDHDWTKSIYVDNKNQVCLEDNHFYKKQDKNGSIVVKNFDGEPYKLHEALKMYTRMFESYWELKEIADRYGIRIINNTQGSFIDAFERAEV
jgi:hypothetical protein